MSNYLFLIRLSQRGQELILDTCRLCGAVVSRDTQSEHDAFHKRRDNVRLVRPEVVDK